MNKHEKTIQGARCKGLVKPKTALHPYMESNCENLKQDTIPVSACIVAQKRGFKPCKICEQGGLR